MNPVEAKRRIVAQWLERPAGQRLDAHIADFYGELVESGSCLLSFHSPVDRFERIKKWLLPYTSL
jgi:hypothetical protein